MSFYCAATHTLPMRRFEAKEVREAMAYADAGGIALHVWEAAPKMFSGAPSCFNRSSLWAHLMCADRGRLIVLARRLGVRVIKVGREGRRGQHVDLCGRPLERALVLATEPPIGSRAS